MCDGAQSRRHRHINTYSTSSRVCMRVITCWWMNIGLCLCGFSLLPPCLVFVFDAATSSCVCVCVCRVSTATLGRAVRQRSRLRASILFEIICRKRNKRHPYENHTHIHVCWVVAYHRANSETDKNKTPWQEKKEERFSVNHPHQQHPSIPRPESQSNQDCCLLFASVSVSRHKHNDATTRRPWNSRAIPYERIHNYSRLDSKQACLH